MFEAANLIYVITSYFKVVGGLTCEFWGGSLPRCPVDRDKNCPYIYIVGIYDATGN